MSYHSLALLAQDEGFAWRIAACAVEQEVQADADLKGQNATSWALGRVWQVAASPGFAASYQYALDTGVEDPGVDPAVITDEQILASVQALLG